MKNEVQLIGQTTLSGARDWEVVSCGLESDCRCVDPAKGFTRGLMEWAIGERGRRPPAVAQNKITTIAPTVNKSLSTLRTNSEKIIHIRRSCHMIATQMSLVSSNILVEFLVQAPRRVAKLILRAQSRRTMTN